MSTTAAAGADYPDTTPKLTKKEKWDVIFLILAFFCVVASLTMVVGTVTLVVLSVGGNNSLAPYGLAFLFLGMSTVSLGATGWIFALWGRKIGFWVGCVSGVLGSAICAVALVQSSTGLVFLGQYFLGAAFGIGMYLRFSGVEVVSSAFSSKVVSWVLAGGCLAAFVGPEITLGTAGVFGDEEKLTYMGTFIGSSFFFILEAVFVALVGFPETSKAKRSSEVPPQTQRSLSSEFAEPEKDPEEAGTSDSAAEEKTKTNAVSPGEPASFWPLLRQWSFLLPMGAGSCVWVIMALPMTIFRVTMGELGFTSRQSLTVIEVHFFCMYSPGFVSGAFIQKYGPVRACQVSIACLAICIGIFLSIQDNDNTTAAWFVGFVFLAFGWNFGFSSATVWSTQCYKHAMHLKPKIQAANDGIVFLFSGIATFCTGYIYEDGGGGGINGWRLCNYVLIVVLTIFISIVVTAIYQLKSNTPEVPSKQLEQIKGQQNDTKQ